MKKTTIRDVARLAGLSVSTVSAAFRTNSRIAPATRKRAIAAADQLGWRPDRRASSLRRSDTTVIGMMYEVERPFQSSLVDNVYEAAKQQSLDVILAGATRHHSELDCLRLLLGERCSALLLTGSTLVTQHLEEASGLVPIVMLARYTDLPRIDCVYSDPQQGARLAVEHLIGLGHRRIMHVAGVERSMARERADGYRAAMTRSGFENFISIISAGNDAIAGVQVADAIVDRTSRPTAITCYNDTVAMALVRRLRQRGLSVPEDISVIGYNDQPSANDPTVSLTTVRQGGEEMASRAFSILRTRLKSGVPVQPGSELRVSMSPTLVVRRTTGAAGSAQ